MFDVIDEAPVRPAPKATIAPEKVDLRPQADAAVRIAAAALPAAARKTEAAPPLWIDAKTLHWLPLAVPLLAITLLTTALVVLANL